MPAVPNDYIDCRDMRHAWVRDTDEVLIEVQGQVRLFTRTLVCVRCESKRIDTYRVATLGRKHHEVVKVGAKYVYAPNYQVKGGFDMSEARWMLFNGYPKSRLKVVGE